MANEQPRYSSGFRGTGMVFLTILIVEDDPRACKAFTSYAESLEDIKIVGISAGAREAVRLICERRPHAVILDLELNNGDGNGLDVLTDVQTARLGYTPFFLITTITTSNAIHNEARERGGAFVLSKHMPCYSEVYAIDFLRQMRGNILRGTSSAIQTPSVPELTSQRIRQQIIAELNWIGISPRMKGRQYLIDAIELLLDGPQDNVSEIISARYKKTSDSVEQAMKYAIEKAWKTTDVDELCEHFKARVRADTGVPTTTEFIYYYAESIRAELNW